MSSNIDRGPVEPENNDFHTAAAETKNVVLDVQAFESSSNDGASADDEEPKAGLKDFVRLLTYAKSLDVFLMLLGILFAAGAGAALPLMNIVFGRLTSDFTTYFIPGSGVTYDQFRHSLDNNSLYLVYLFIGKFGCAYVSMFSFRMTGIRISATIRLQYLDALFRQPVSAVDKLPPGSATESLTTAANMIQFAISDKLALLVQAVALVITAYVIAFKYSWQLTLVSSSTLLLTLIIYSIIVPFWVKAEAKSNASLAKASGVAGEVFRYIRTAKSLSAEKELRKKYSDHSDEAVKASLKAAPNIGLQLSTAFSIVYGNMALSFWYGIKLYTQGHIDTVGTIVTVLFSVLIVVSALPMLVGPLDAIVKAAAASGSIFKILDAPKRSFDGLRDPDVDPDSDIVFTGVRFAYPSRPTVEILKGLDVVIPKGKVTALVGPSGCGKSTIVALLERWYQLSDVNVRVPLHKEKEDDDPEKAAAKKRQAKKDKKSKSTKASKKESPASGDDTTDDNEPREALDPLIQNSGSVSVGGVNLDSLDLKWWRSQIGLVQQEPFLFSDSIYHNVAQGLIGSRFESADDAEKRKLVEQACKEAFADEFIIRLPDGYDTTVGESGIKLSGGQRQRLAIARSLVKQPSILIFDEATSAIDVRSEAIVQKALDNASKNRTTITIAHRLSTIKKADNIVVMKEGVKCEAGTHEQLLQIEDGVYANLVRAQHLELGGGSDDHVTDDPKTVNDVTITEGKESFSETDAQLMTKVAEEDYKKRGFWRSVGLLLYEQRRHYILYFFIVASGAAAGAIYALQSFFFAKFITVFTKFGSDLVNSGNFWALMFFVLSLAVIVIYFVIGFASFTLSVLVSGDYRTDYFTSILAKPISFFDAEEHSSGTLTSRLSNDPRQLQEILGPNLALSLIAVFNIVGCTIISFVFGWKLSLVAFLASLPVILGAAFMRIRYEIQFESYNAKVFADSSKFASEAIGAFRTVSALTMEDSVSSRYEGLLQEHISKAFKRARLAVLIFALSDSLELLSMALTFWYGGTLLGKREYTPTQFFVIYIAIVQGGQAAGQFLGFGPNVANATASANRILGFRGRDEDKQATVYLSESSVSKPSGLSAKFDNVRFKYPTREISVFESVSFELTPGSYTAFVGPSGCGKTTVVSLLARFYQPLGGSITVDGQDISTLSLKAYRESVALVSQEPTVFAGSIRENLLLGLKDAASVTQPELEDACRSAEIHDFVATLPDGYNTQLTAGGTAALSGGQKQRLCIARALLRKPRLLLLDEATSSLDSNSEKAVQRAIEKIASRGDVTIVCVAHRLATIQAADRIIVLGDGGKILEEGPHQDLLRKKGVYWGMCNAQALDR